MCHLLATSNYRNTIHAYWLWSHQERKPNYLFVPLYSYKYEISIAVSLLTWNLFCSIFGIDLKLLKATGLKYSNDKICIGLIDNVGTTEFREQQLRKKIIYSKKDFETEDSAPEHKWTCLHLKIKSEVSKPFCLVWTSREWQLSESPLWKKEGSWTFFKSVVV